MMNEPDAALFRPRLSWSAQDLTAVGVGLLSGGAGSALDEDDQINACLFEVEATARGEGFLMWRRLMMICELLDLVIGRYSDQQRSREDLRVL